MKKRIALLFHKKNNKYHPPLFAITHLARFWAEEGHHVFFVFGTGEKYIPADLAILHIDLSVVPEEYIEYAKQYPIVLNKKVRDIRKSTFSKNLVGPDTPYSGKVIVKSDLNAAGVQESFYYNLNESGREPFFKTASDYKVFDNPGSVPPHFFANEDIVVEKFLPEMEKDLYVVRSYLFLGNKSTSIKLMSKHPIVKSGNTVAFEKIDPHPEIIELREKLNFDYGKFDYVIHNDRVILLDVNKTTGAPRNIPSTPEMIVERRQRAAGIYAYFSD